MGSIFGDWVWPLLEFLVGVGLVIFVHELGHFLAAKAVNIKVEVFAMGIGPRIAGFRRGETEYVLNLLLPLGGYVKMLGQDDVRPPNEQAAQAGGGAPSSASAAAGATAFASPADRDADPVRSPRAFQNKSVGQRMIVIAGGVVMNVVPALVLFVVVGVVGKPYRSSVLGAVVPGTPAALARIEWAAPPATMPATSPAFPDANVGLRPGDRIVGIDGDRFLMRLLRKDVESFDKVAMIALLANDHDQYTLAFERTADGQVLRGKAHLGVRTHTSEMGTERRGFGIQAASDTLLGEAEVRADSPFRRGDRVVSLGGRKIDHEWEFDAWDRCLDGNAVEVGVLRDGNELRFALRPTLSFSDERAVFFDPNDGRRLVALPHQPQDANFLRVRDPDGNRLELLLADVLPGRELDILGMVPRLAVRAVLPKSPADQAGLQPGDVIYEYGDVRNPSFGRFSEVKRKVAGTGANLTVLRGEKLVGPISVRPKAKGEDVNLGFLSGIDADHLVLGAVRPGSPAARAGLREGDLVVRAGGADVRTWTDLFRQTCRAEGKDLSLTVKRGDQEMQVSLGEVTRRVFSPDDYRFSVRGPELPFEPLMETIRKGPLDAIGWGVNQTWEFILSTYATLRQLVVGTVSPKEAAGPVGVGQMAILSARKGLMQLVYLMAIISASVAVVNFLPFPVLDGGHAVLLIVEKFRGRALPVKVQWALQVFGLVCIILLFVLLTWNDIWRILRE